MSEPHTSHQDTKARLRLAAAREAARAVTFELARDTGAGIITRPVFSDRAEPVTRDVEPLAGARAARDLEHAARRAARDYIRQAREAGRDWDQIGRALGMDRSGAEPGASPADSVYTYAAGQPDTEVPWRPRSFGWTCRSCDKHIADRGLIEGPADDEPPGCRRTWPPPFATGCA